MKISDLLTSDQLKQLTIRKRNTDFDIHYDAIPMPESSFNGQSMQKVHINDKMELLVENINMDDVYIKKGEEQHK